MDSDGNRKRGLVMEAEKFCVSLEAAKRLHEAGIMVDSYFHWAIISQKITFNPLYNEVYVLDHKTKEFWNANNNLGGNSISAPQAEELEYYITDGYTRVDLAIGIKYFGGKLGIVCKIDYTFIVSGDHNKRCEALAELAIKLKEAGYENNC